MLIPLIWPKAQETYYLQTDNNNNNNNKKNGKKEKKGIIVSQGEFNSPLFGKVISSRNIYAKSIISIYLEVNYSFI